MSDYPQKNIPLKLITDKFPTDLQPDEMFDSMNHEIGLTTTSTGAGTNSRATPMASNYQLCDITMPAGEVYSVGSFSEKRTNKVYDWVYNANGVHFIKRINADGSCEVVYHGCLDLSAEPRHHIKDFRADMKIEKVCPNRDGFYLRWTQGTEWGIGHLDVEASIATNFFTTPFFELGNPDPCDFVKLCVPEICGCIHARYIPLLPTEIGLSNNLLNKSFKFAVKHVYYDNRQCEWSDWSSLYYQETNTCFSGNSLLSRCMELTLPLGNPMVEKVLVAYSDDGGITWFLTDTVEKYEKYNDGQQKWYQRALAPLSGIDLVNNTFIYKFCNDKERVQIGSDEFTRVRNPFPREAQGFFDIKESLAVYNYKDGTCPIDKKEYSKINIGIIPDANITSCDSEYATVTVRAIVHGYAAGDNRMIYRFGGNNYNDIDDNTDTAYFGGTGTSVLTGGLVKTFGQNFESKTRNFICYIEGTDYWQEMKQWQADKGFTNHRQVGVVAKMSDNATQQKMINIISNGSYYYQECSFKVLKGTRGFLRLASHHATDGTGDSQNTSTTVYSLHTDITKYTSRSADQSFFDKTKKEIYFDTCNGNVDLLQAFQIADLNLPAALSGIDFASYNGYIKDASGLPIEGLVLSSPYSATTDHNGFYFFNSPNLAPSVPITGETSCTTFGIIQTMALAGSVSGVSTHNELITNDTFNKYYFIKIQQKLIGCDGGPIPGIRIAIAGSKSRVTGNDGIATLIVRNYQNRKRRIQTVVMNGNGCFTLDCSNNCNPCMPYNDQLGPSCYFNTAGGYFNMPVARVNAASIFDVKRGLKSGGRYPFAVVAKGNCGRLSDANKLKYLDIPRTQEKNKLGFNTFSFDFGTSVYPDWVSCLQIVRGQNENPFELQWVVDKIERTGDGKIKLTIQSLNDYNQKYYFQSNTVYQWLKGDRIEFVRNGDGRILTTANNSGVLNYLTISPFHDTLVSGLTATTTPANYFNQLLIEDDNRLGSLVAGAIIEIQRPKTSVGETIYYDICVSIPVVNGIPQITGGSFNTFDTYIISRTSGSFLGNFESKYPSDFWGKITDGVGLDDTGKRYVNNPYATEKRFGQNVTVSSPTQYNYFGDIIKTVTPLAHGDIVGASIRDGRIVMIVSERDNSLAQSADDLLRVGADGTIRALPADSVISTAEPKVRGQYGCQYDSVGSLYFGDGYAAWIDVTRDAYVVHDYREARDVSFGQTQNFFRKKCREIANANKPGTDPLNKMRLVTGWNQNTGALMTTFKTLRQPGYNNDFDPYGTPNVTIAYHPGVNIFLTRPGFTPEAYANFDLQEDGGCAFVSFLHGVPYVHPKVSDSFLEYYGVTTDWAFGIALNQFPEKDKSPLSFEIQSTMKWFVKQVTIENANFISEIPPIRVERDKDKFNGAFLNNINSEGGLYDGDVPQGYYANILFIRDNTIDDQVNTVDPEKRRRYSDLGYVFLKFRINEQSGFSNNL